MNHEIRAVIQELSEKMILVLDISSKCYIKNLDELKELDVVKKEMSRQLFRKLKIYYPEKLGRPFALVAQHGRLNFPGTEETIVLYLDGPIDGVEVVKPENYPDCYF